MPRVGFIEATVLDHQGSGIEQVGGTLVVVPVGTRSLQKLQPEHIETASFIIVGDPLGRLQRLYGGPMTLPPGRCQTFLIDPCGILRLYLAHNLADWGRDMLTELVRAYQDQEAAALP